MPNLAFALCIFSALSPIQGERLTLEDAIRIAEQNSYGLKIAKTIAEKTRQRIAEVRGQQGPKVSVDSSYSRVEISGSSFAFPNDQSQAALRLSMPVDITGVIGRGIRASEVAMRSAEALVESERNDLRQRVRAAYYRELQSEALVKVADEALKNAQDRLDVTMKEFELGTKARIDVVQIDTQVRQRQAEVLAAQNNVRLAKQNLNNTISRPIETPVETVDVAELPKVAAAPDDLVGQAMQRRPDIAAQDFNIQSLALVRAAQEGGLYPSLQLTASHQRTFGQPGFGGGRETTTGTLGLSVPLWDSGVTRARVKQARQDEEAAKLRLDQLKLGVSLEVRQALSNLGDAWQRYEVSQKSVELAAETYRLTKIRYDAGEAIQLEVVDAQTELTRAQSNLVTSRYDYLAAYAALQRASASDNPGEPAPGGQHASKENGGMN